MTYTGAILDRETEAHLARLEAAVFNSYSITDASRWITDHTYLNEDRFSFKDHEFQQRILDDPSRVINVQKCAQIGMSEAMARYVLALCRIIPGFSAILTFPFSGDSENFMRTRINPVVSGSPDLKASVDNNLDNVSIKAFGSSLLYLRGTSGATQALSIPADILIHDEIDRSDPAVIGQYQSRLRHSKWKLVRKFGTPTLAKRGISAEMDVSKRYRNICKCHHCNHFFIPDYYEHVVIPGYKGDIKDINKDTIRTIDWHNATLICPKCGDEPSLAPEYREWVMENPGDNFEAIGYFCSPFDVPKMTSTPQLVLESTKYTTQSEFQNQALGIVADNSNDQITEADLLNCKVSADLNSSNVHMMGCDMGLTCYIMIGRMLGDALIVVYREKVGLEKFESRRLELQQKYSVITTVIDSQPYTDIILRIQGYDPNCYGGVYHQSKDLATYAIKKVDRDDAKGKLPINQAMINRDLAFDEVMYLTKAEPKQLIWRAQDEDDEKTFIVHMLDMKRTQVIDRNGDVRYTWQKSSDGNDHWMHTLLYLYTACRLSATVYRGTVVSNVPVVKSFQVHDKSKTDIFRRR